MSFDLSASSGGDPVPPDPAGLVQTAIAPGASPIADLSYRGYDGPIHSRAARWLVVALANIRMICRRPWFWVWAGLALLIYIFHGIALYVQSMARANPMNPMAGAMSGPPYAETFYKALEGQGFFLFLLAVLVGSASIAADNQTNALLVYLSRPLTKLDYLVGKWMGIFLPLYGAAAIPALLLYLFCLISYTSDGFWSQDRLLIGRLLLATLAPAVLHSSLILGCSAWSRTPRMAGVFYAGLYFVSATLSGIIWQVRYHHDLARSSKVAFLSLEGIITGLAQNAYHVTLHPTVWHKRHKEMQQLIVHPPSLLPMLLLALGLVAVGLAAAAWKVRAVEVVRG